jgi:hypothetical protein
MGEEMNWVFWAFIVAAVIHIVEEYKYPGGFSDAMKRFNPRFAPFVTVKFTVVINGLFLLVCFAGAIVGDKSLAFSLSVASLLLFNALMHIIGTIRMKRYVPGAVSSVLLYLPLSFYAYYLFANSGRLSLLDGIVSILLGALYQAVPIASLASSSAVKRV